MQRGVQITVCRGCNCSPAKPGLCPAHYPLPEALALQSSLLLSNDGPWHFDTQSLQVQAIGALERKWERKLKQLEPRLARLCSFPGAQAPRIELAKQQIGWTFRSTLSEQRGSSLFNRVTPLPLRAEIIVSLACYVRLDRNTEESVSPQLPSACIPSGIG